MKNISSKIIYILAVLVLVAVYFFYQNQYKPKYAQAVVDISSHTVYADIADTPAKLNKGLAVYDHLDPDRGMLFVLPTEGVQTFWMKDMKFSIDLIWIRHGRVAGWEKEMRIPAPGTADKDLQLYTSPNGIDRVLEVPAGGIDAWGIRINDPVSIKYAE